MDPLSLWLTPLILLPGVGLLIVSTSNRYNRLHDEVHDMIDHRHASVPMDQLLIRGRLFRNALVSLYCCVALFSLASLLGVVAEELGAGSEWIVLTLLLLGILCLSVAAMLLIRESLLSFRIIESHHGDVD
ncbi:MAG: DUF2721 domain-containing protein [Rhodothermales bacterium]|nr:DUF2721 domain-containing protein [Rhodothermales bacterium]